MGKRGPKRDENAEKRILDATRDLICARGPSSVTIDDIVAKAGVGKQTIYRWWPSKAAVVYAALSREIEATTTPDKVGSPIEDVRNHMHQIANLMASQLGPIVKELLIESLGNAEIAEQFRTQFFAGRSQAAAIAIREAVERGELREDLDVNVAIDLLYSPLWVRMIIGHQPLTPDAVDEIINQVWPSFTNQPMSALSPA